MPIEEELVFAGESAAAVRLRLQVARIAPHFRVALLTGEAGTGVATVARRLHALSPAADAPFCCLSAGDFAADAVLPPSGVLFLHGLEMVETALQPTLLRRLNTVARATRILLGTECDPRGMIATNRLRADLYERIATLEIRIAPLRERSEDLRVLLAGGPVFGERAAERLRLHSWPGNLEELAEVIARVAPLDRVVEPEDLGLPEERHKRVIRLDEVIERHVVDVLERVGGNKLRAAELLGISRSTLYRMLESVGA